MQNCWKPLVFFYNEHYINEFTRKLMLSNVNFPFKLITKGIVAYARSVEDRDKIIEVFRKISFENSIRCRILWRHSGRYWQDMFPELSVRILMVISHSIEMYLSLENWLIRQKPRRN